MVWDEQLKSYSTGKIVKKVLLIRNLNTAKWVNGLKSVAMPVCAGLDYCFIPARAQYYLFIM